MKSILLTLLLTLNFPHLFAQFDQINVSSISFLPGQVQYEDTVFEMPVMHISLILSSVDMLGKVTIDVMDSEGSHLFIKKEYFAAEIAELWSEGVATFTINFLDPQQNYMIKTTLETFEQLHIPQLVNTYP